MLEAWLCRDDDIWEIMDKVKWEVLSSSIILEEYKEMYVYWSSNGSLTVWSLVFVCECWSAWVEADQSLSELASEGSEGYVWRSAAGIKF